MRKPEVCYFYKMIEWYCVHHYMQLHCLELAAFVVNSELYSQQINYHLCWCANTASYSLTYLMSCFLSTGVRYVLQQSVTGWYSYTWSTFQPQSAAPNRKWSYISACKYGHAICWWQNVCKNTDHVYKVILPLMWSYWY